MQVEMSEREVRQCIIALRQRMTMIEKAMALPGGRTRGAKGLHEELRDLVMKLSKAIGRDWYV